MKFTKGAIAGLFSSLLVLTGAAGAATVTIDGAQTYQTIDGFGVNANHRSWNNSELQPVLDALIDQAGMTLFRVIFDKADWEATNDNSDPNVMNWSYYNAVYSASDFQKMWDMAAYLNQKGISNGLMFNFQGGGPTWMGGDTLTVGYEAEWAEMVASLFIYARNTQHLQFTLVAPDNEEDIISQGVDMTASQYVTALHILAQLLDTNGLSDLRFVGPDLGDTSTAWLSAMMNDPVVMAKLAHFGLHSYQDNGGGSSGIYDFLQQSAYPDRTFWMTEFNVWCSSCEGGQGGTNSWAYASGAALYLLYHLANGASAGLVWEGYDSQYNYYSPGQWSYWGLFAVDDVNAVPKTYTARKIFYTLAQITKFVRAGAQQISVSGASAPLTLLAFYNTNNGQLTLTGVNTDSSASSLSCALTLLPAIPSLDLYYTSSTTNLCYGAHVVVSNGGFSLQVPADCVFTLVGSNSAAVAVSVVITNPLDGASYTALANIPIAATASTTSGSVSRVEFFCGTTNIGEALSPPYGITWSNVPAGTYMLTASATNSLGNFGVSSGVHVTVAGVPVITQQPQSQAVAVASTAVFTATASGVAPLSYQWLFKGTNLANGGQFSGATSPTLSLSNAQPSNAGGYSVVVTNVAGSATSTVATLTVNVPGSCLTPPPGLVGWWPGDGNAQDIQGTNNGTLEGGATATAAGMVGQAFSFDGTNGYVQIPDSPVLRPTNLTIEAWVLFTSLDSAESGGSPPGQQYVVFKQNARSSDFEGYYLGKERGPNGDFLGFGVSSSSGQSVEVDSTALLGTGVWYHVAGVRGSNYIQLYVNGLLDSQTNVSFPQDYGTNALYFGTSGQAYWDGKFSGLLDEVSLYNRALSSNEVAAIYAAGSAGKCRTSRVVVQPPAQLGYWGGSASFTSAISGALPTSYQWQKNGVGINGATASSLVLTKLQLTNAGSYTLWISSASGNATSAPARLSIKVADLWIALWPMLTQSVAGLTIGGVANQTYGLEAVADLRPTNGWIGLTNLTLTAPTNVWYDPAPATRPERFYRLVPGPISIP